MPSPPKTFFHNIPYEICTSVQTGLPFVATDYMKLLIEGVLGAAQTLYPVTICHYVVMTNHIHMLLIVKDPEDIPKFMHYLKLELAHAVNRLLGRTGQSFWVEGYDSPMVLSPEKFLERMEYLYLNPTDAGLERSIEKYPGSNSFSSLSETLATKSCKKVSRDQVPELPERYLNKKQRRELANMLSEVRGINYELKIEPWAWLQCYSSSKEWDLNEVRERFLTCLRAEEARIAKAKVSVIGAERLEAQDIRQAYKSERSGKKMICMSHCPEQRRTVIEFVKNQTRRAREAYQRRKAGESSALPPPGFFLPGGALLANLVFPLFQL